jgi:hypothetical protein
MWNLHDITVPCRSARGREVCFMATNSDREGTGKKPASNAGKLLRDPKTPKKVKDVAASDLAQAPRKPKKGK